MRLALRFGRTVKKGVTSQKQVERGTAGRIQREEESGKGFTNHAKNFRGG